MPTYRSSTSSPEATRRQQEKSPSTLRPAHTFPLNPSRGRLQGEFQWRVGRPSLSHLAEDEMRLIQRIEQLGTGESELRSELESELRNVREEERKTQEEIRKLEDETHNLEAELENLKPDFNANVVKVDPMAVQMLPFLTKIKKIEDKLYDLGIQFRSSRVSRETYHAEAGPLNSALESLYTDATTARLRRVAPDGATPLSSKDKEHIHHELNRLADDLQWLEREGYPHRDERSPPAAQRSTLGKLFRRSSRQSLAADDTTDSTALARQSSSSGEAAELSGAEDMDPKWVDRMKKKKIKSAGDLTRFWTRRGSRSGGRNEESEEEELSRIPHVGFRAGLRYYGRAY
ncbi:hypothetical protein JCM11251_001984 [Rhodosporidiobolus azoricus]